MKHRATRLMFALLAGLTVSAWVAAFKAVFPIAPALYSLSGWLSL